MKKQISNSTGASVIHTLNMRVPEGFQAEYTASITFFDGDTLSLKLGDTELLTMGTDTFRLCDSHIRGQFGAGSYTVRVTANPVQQLLLVDMTLPDGGTLRRGSFDLLGGEDFCWYATREDAVTGADLRYAKVTPEKYEISQELNIRPGFDTEVYNLVNCFDDPQTTRLLSWTAKESFVRDTDGMALRYRVKGETAWAETDARLIPQATPNGQESYFKADLSGLTADTEYEYMIGLKGREAPDTWSQLYTFKTAPAEIGDFRFIAVGDTQSGRWSEGYTFCRAAVDRAWREAEDAAFMLNAGDMTDWGSYLHLWNWYFRSIEAYSPRVPHFAAPGNHDTWTDDENNYFALHFNHPDNGAHALDPAITAEIGNKHLRVQARDTEDCIYSYNYGDVHFTVLHSGSYVEDDRYMMEAQRQWLIRDLEANRDALWKIILVHEPVYHRKGVGEDRPWLHDVIEDYGVDLVLQGHSHLVTRTYPMKNGRIVTKSSPDRIRKGSGTVYTTIGSTATNHDTAGENTVEECLLIATPHPVQPTYTVVSVEKERLVVTVKQINGLVVDGFAIWDDGNAGEGTQASNS